MGYGTTFRIYFPRVSRPALDSDIMADSFDERAEREAGARFAPTTTAQSDALRDIETILLVEDDASVRELAVDILRSHGYRVLPAKNGTEALQLSLQHDGAIHLLLTDVVLPETGGRELADVLLRHRPAMKVLFTSGYTQETIASHGVLAEEIFFLSKPLTLTSLIQKVREVLAPGA